MNKLRALALGLVIAAGIITLLASSLEEERIRLPPMPVKVEYELKTSTSFKIERESRDSIVTAMQLTGFYDDVFSGDGLTLDRTIVSLDNISSLFTLEIVATDDELDEATAEVEINSPLDLRLDNSNPSDGRFTSLFNETHTIVQVVTSPSTGVNVFIGDAADPLFRTWPQFVESEAEASADLNERMASAAYNTLSAILRAVLVVEDIVRDIESNTLDSTVTLQVDCENQSSTEGDMPYKGLTWTDGTTGTGQGNFDINDSFEAAYTNCLDMRDRFLDGRAELRNYVPDGGDGLRTLSVRAELSEFFNSENAVTRFVTMPTATSPRYGGELTLNYVEMPR